MLDRKLGVALIGMGGAVATTAIAGIETIKAGLNGTDGLPLAGRHVHGLAPYASLVFGGWDLSGDDLATAVLRHGVLSERDLSSGASALRDMRPSRAVGSTDFCANISGAHKIAAGSHRHAVDIIQTDLAGLRSTQGVDGVVMVNLASVERLPDLDAVCLQDIDAFEQGLDRSDPAISPSMLYAYAAITATRRTRTSRRACRPTWRR